MVKGIGWKGVRPWSTFIDVSKFKQPPTAWNRFEKKVAANSVYFAGNYLWVMLAVVVFMMMSSPVMLIVSALSIGLLLVALRPPAVAQAAIQQAVSKTGMKFLEADGVQEKARLYMAVLVASFLLVLIGGLYQALFAWLLAVLVIVAHAATRQVPEGVEQVRLRLRQAPTLGSWLTTMGAPAGAAAGPSPAAGPAGGGSGGGSAGGAVDPAAHGHGASGTGRPVPGFGDGSTVPSSGGRPAETEGAFMGEGGSAAEPSPTEMGQARPGFGDDATLADPEGGGLRPRAGH